MRNIGTGKVEFFVSNGTIRELEGELEINKDRLVVTEIIYLNGRPGAAREINLPLSQCVIYWKPDLYDDSELQA